MYIYSRLEVEEVEKAEEAEMDELAKKAQRCLRITKAKGRTYLQEKDGMGKLRLVVEVSEAKTMNHAEVIETIYKALMKDINMGKAEALAMRREICG
jgi:hypothetical protein